MTRAAHRPLETDAAISDRFVGATLRRAITRAYLAGDLTISEIANEFGCSRQYVTRVTLPLRKARSDVDLPAGG